MGSSLTWLALENATAADAAALLGVDITPEQALPGKAPLVGAPLPGGWYLVVADACDAPLLSDDVLRRASQDRRVVAASLEEHVMFCSAALWSAGTLRWRVTHDPDRHGVRDLRVEGEPPPGLAALRAEAETMRTQEERTEDPHGRVDWHFEVPVRLAHDLAGFKHDEFPDALDDAFRTLRPLPGGALAARRPWWRFW